MEIAAVEQRDGDGGASESVRGVEAAKAAAPYVHKKQPQDVNLDANVNVPTAVTMRVVGPRRPAGAC